MIVREEIVINGLWVENEGEEEVYQGLPLRAPPPQLPQRKTLSSMVGAAISQLVSPQSWICEELTTDTSSQAENYIAFMTTDLCRVVIYTHRLK